MFTIIEKYAFDTSISPPIYAIQTFAKSDRNLEHYIDGKLRAVIEAANVPDYLASPNIAQALTEKQLVAIDNEFAGAR